MYNKSRESGFTVIEVTTVLLIIIILILIAIPAYLGVRDRAFDTQARSNIRNGVFAAKQYETDELTHVGMNAARLRQYIPNSPINDTVPDCLVEPTGSDSIHGIIYVQIGLTDGSACIAVWSKGSDKRFTWTISSDDVESLSIR